jgi:hypothetical protein
MEYRLRIDLEVLEVLDGLAKADRRRLLAQFHKIRSFPGNYADYYQHDAVGRRAQISIVAGWAIHYWEDFADRQVKILTLGPADK